MKASVTLETVLRGLIETGAWERYEKAVTPRRDFITSAPSQMIGRMGLMTVTPSKSRSLAVTTIQSFASATVAMMVSSALRGRPRRLPSAISRAQRSTLNMRGPSLHSTTCPISRLGHFSRAS